MYAYWVLGEGMFLPVCVGVLCFADLCMLIGFQVRACPCLHVCVFYVMVNDV